MYDVDVRFLVNELNSLLTNSQVHLVASHIIEKPNNRLHVKDEILSSIADLCNHPTLKTGIQSIHKISKFNPRI